MITTAEVIAWFENRLAGITMPGARRMYEQALTILRAQQEREDPEPLTLAELREMEGEPVWIAWHDGRVPSKWWIVGGYDWNLMEYDDDLTQERYGKTWLAYRYKPEEEAHTLTVAEMPKHQVCEKAAKPTTNAARIRAMSDEELAEWLTTFALEAFTAGLIGLGTAMMEKEERLIWLQQPAEVYPHEQQ